MLPFNIQVEAGAGTESNRYTKELPDADYIRYVVSRNDCLNLKKLAADFSAYSSLDSILLDPRKELSEAKLYSLKYNWECHKLQYAHKANYICHNKNEASRQERECKNIHSPKSCLHTHDSGNKLLDIYLCLSFENKF